MVRTLPFHGSNMGSNPVGVTLVPVILPGLFVLLGLNDERNVGSPEGIPVEESRWGHLVPVILSGLFSLNVTDIGAQNNFKLL